MGKISLTSCRALSTPGKFSNVDRYVLGVGKTANNVAILREVGRLPMFIQYHKSRGHEIHSPARLGEC